MVVKSVGVVSVGKIYGAISGTFGLIAGGIFTLASLAGAAIGATAGEEPGAAFFGLVFGVGAIVILPLVYAVFGFIAGVVGALIYNVAAGFLGGVEIEVE